MKVAGIIAEYNPFHLGHAYLAQKARENGATHIVAVMSGNFVQRGIPSLFDHETRTAAALMNGVDLVLQLPAVYAVSSAQNFAKAGTDILNGLGIVDELVFGSECGKIEKINAAVDALESEDFKPLLDAELKKGIAFASARENALRLIDAEAADIVKSPNNILGVEYVAALRSSQSKITPITFGRIGANHDSNEAVNGIASASQIRNNFSDNEWEKFVPQNSVCLYKSAETTDIKNIESAILYKMRTVDAVALSRVPDISEGIENRIISAAAEAKSLDELYSLAKTKRYSHARIRRIVLNCFLGITAEDLALPVPYIRITGFNKKGVELIKKAKCSAKMPIITKAADIAALGNDAQRIFSLECTAGNIYALCFKEPLPCGTEKKFKPVIISDQ